jgi:cytochrome b
MSSTTSIKTKLVIDFLVAGLVLVLLSTALTGLALHEWLGIAIGTALVVHLLMGWKWIASITQRFLQSLPGQTRITYVLDLLLFVSITLTIYSGLMISRVALPALGLNGGAPNFLWRGLHSLAANSLLVLVGLHLAVSWSWIVKNVSKYILEPLRLRSAQSSSTATNEKE